MRSLAVVLALWASLSHAGIGDPPCDAQCSVAVGAILATAFVLAVHGVFFHGLVHDEPALLRVGGVGLMVLYSVSALFAAGFLLDSFASNRHEASVGGSALWLAASFGAVGLGAYGVHRSTIISIAPQPGGASIGLALRW
jgi:hypothetical protein